MNPTCCRRCKIVLPGSRELARRVLNIRTDARKAAKIEQEEWTAVEGEPPRTFDDLACDLEDVIREEIAGLLEGLCVECQLEGASEPVTMHDVARPVRELEWLMNDESESEGTDLEGLLERRELRRVLERRRGGRPN